MFPSETEIDSRLTELRHRRDLVEREIADLLLYRDLGRRLAGSEPREAPGLDQSGPSQEPFHDSPREAVAAGRAPAGTMPELAQDSPRVPTQSRHGAARALGTPMPDRSVSERRPPPGPPVGFEEDPVAARRYGRAMMEAALDGLREAGRPLHAGEILERVIARGFSLPGQDPVAALNTRLWKRSGPGGPLRRLGDAVYALVEPPDA